MKPARLITTLLFAAAAATHAAPAPVAAAGVDPTRFIGMDITAAVDSLGLPQQMFTWRGADETRDNVVFYYADALYLFWYRDRVWQVRFDKRYTAAVLGLSLGTFHDVVMASIPHPLTANDDSVFFDIDSAAFPIRVRLVFANELLSDVYVYRSDF